MALFIIVQLLVIAGWLTGDFIFMLMLLLYYTDCLVYLKFTVTTTTTPVMVYCNGALSYSCSYIHGVSSNFGSA